MLFLYYNCWSHIGPILANGDLMSHLKANRRTLVLSDEAHDQSVIIVIALVKNYIRYLAQTGEFNFPCGVAVDAVTVGE